MLEHFRDLSCVSSDGIKKYVKDELRREKMYVQKYIVWKFLIKKNYKTSPLVAVALKKSYSSPGPAQ